MLYCFPGSTHMHGVGARALHFPAAGTVSSTLALLSTPDWRQTPAVLLSLGRLQAGLEMWGRQPCKIAMLVGSKTCQEVGACPKLIPAVFLASVA